MASDSSQEIAKLQEIVKDLQEQINYLGDQLRSRCPECNKCYKAAAQCSRCYRQTCRNCSKYEDSVSPQLWFCSGTCKVEYFRKPY